MQAVNKPAVILLTSFMVVALLAMSARIKRVCDDPLQMTNDE